MNYTQITAAIAKDKAGRPNATAFAWHMVGTAPDWLGCEVSICDVQTSRAGTPMWSTSCREQTVMVTTAEVEAWKLSSAVARGEDAS